MKKESFKKNDTKEQENFHNFKTESKSKKSNLANSAKKEKIIIKENSKNRKQMNNKYSNFELALKNKNNLDKAQYNLFSPDKFTNTQFCDCDYLEYTLGCMEIFLKLNKAQKQQKNKVNLNFPNTKGYKLKKKIALFDLDETLVHCTGDINLKKEPFQNSFEIFLRGNKITKVGINIRPLWKKTLNIIKKYYYIVVFTASHQAYADAVLDFMDPHNKYFKYRLYRNNCSLVNVDGIQFYVKNLDIFDEFYDLKDIIIIDNSALSFIYHLENGIPIVPYYNEDEDGSLYVVGLYLKHIYKENDLREANKKYINLESFLNEAKKRNDSWSSIVEESTFNNKDINNEKNNLKDTTRNQNIVEHNTIQDIHLKNPRRCSFSFGNSTLKLKVQSKLINMYYEVNNGRTLSDKKIEEVIEEKSKKNFSIDEDEEINENKSSKNIADLFYRKRMLTSDDKPITPKRNSKSNKQLYKCTNIKFIHSNFYINFCEDVFFIK